MLRLGAAYNSAAQRAPAVTGIVTTVVKTAAADAFAQLVVEKKDKVDLKRNAMFCGFGFAYLGCWQYVLYAKMFPKWTLSITAIVGQRLTPPVLVFLDQMIHHPILYFPSFYLLRGAMEGQTASASLKSCSEDMPENLKSLWALWVPAQLINFTFVPVHLRIPFVAGVSFLWCIILSAMRGELNDTENQLGEAFHHHMPSGAEAAHMAKTLAVAGGVAVAATATATATAVVAAP